MGATAVAQWLRALAALPEDLCSPAPAWWLTAINNFSPQRAEMPSSSL